MVSKAEFEEAVEKVRRIKEKVASTSERVTMSDLVETMIAVTNVTGKFRGRMLIVTQVRREILKRAGVKRRD